MTDEPLVPAPEAKLSNFRKARRIARIILGFTTILLGLVLAIPMIPGPGFVFVIAGLALLATEYVWARRYLNRVKQGGEALTSIFFRRKPPPDKPKET